MMRLHQREGRAVPTQVRTSAGRLGHQQAGTSSTSAVSTHAWHLTQPACVCWSADRSRSDQAPGTAHCRVVQQCNELELLLTAPPRM